ncbi:MAG: hypothetical protein GWP91_20465, partial [Rhodobacterales bacterium]|nr:hypothetical protein [Rhodobacterales bacterium]
DDDCDGDGFPVDTDCNDTDDTIFPGATEVPFDGIDQDCAGDDECDQDADGLFALDCGGGDCNDADANIFPGANDVPYDGIDQDCDGSDECDIDNDGSLATACGGDDCNDADAGVNVGATDVPYDGIDQDCNGDDNCDQDGDGFDAAECGGSDCNDVDETIHPNAADPCYDGIDQDCAMDGDCDCDGDGYVPDTCDSPLPAGDCDDDDAAINPGADDTPSDGVDSDCDGTTECDDDGDGFLSLDCGGDDCNDADPKIFPGAAEVPYDGLDQDCDGEDECDVDDDGFIATECGGDDCLDLLSCCHPGALEIENDGVDQDCDGVDGSFAPKASEGCGCSATGNGGSAPLFLIGALALLARRRRGVVVTAALMAAPAAQALTITVPGDQPTIADAVAAASAGDTILDTPAAGDISNPPEQTLIIIDKDLTIQSTTGSALATLPPLEVVGAHLNLQGVTVFSFPGAIGGNTAINGMAGCTITGDDVAILPDYVITGDTAWLNANRGIAADNCTVTLTNLEISGMRWNAPLVMTNGSTFDITGCDIHDNPGLVDFEAEEYNMEAGALYMWGASGTLRACDLHDNNPSTIGWGIGSGAIFASLGSLTLEDVNIDRNVGLGLAYLEDLDTVLTNVAIRDNGDFLSLPGSIYGWFGTLTANDLTFTGNDGNVWLDGFTSEINNATFTGAVAVPLDAGLLGGWSGDLSCTDCDFSAGESVTTGGCLAFSEATISLTDASLTDCTTAGDGGAAWFGPSTNATLTRTTIDTATATSGGALSLSQGFFFGGARSSLETDDLIINNTTATYGGAVYYTNADVTLRGGTISNTTASGYGGGFFVPDWFSVGGDLNDDGPSLLQLEGVTQSNATAVFEGGVFWTGSVNTVRATASSFRNNDAAAGALSWTWDGNLDLQCIEACNNTSPEAIVYSGSKAVASNLTIRNSIFQDNDGGGNIVLAMMAGSGLALFENNTLINPGQASAVTVRDVSDPTHAQFTNNIFSDHDAGVAYINSVAQGDYNL